jgi:hypothetical protein
MTFPASGILAEDGVGVGRVCEREEVAAERSTELVEVMFGPFNLGARTV